MQQSILTKIKLFLARNRQNRIFRNFVHVLCCMVVFATTYALILPAITLEQETFCGKEAHEHTESCLQASLVPTLVCTPETLGLHIHSADCYSPERAVLCGQADYVVHSHNSSCYDSTEELVCLLPERSRHVHGASCYIPGETLPEVLHSHSEDCYVQEKGELSCTQEEREGHAHGSQCYGPGTLLECGLTENHLHGDACYSLPLSCTLSTEPHVHSDGCYAAGALQCTTAEYHSHTDDCWEKTRICGLSEGGHQHSDNCWETNWLCESDEESHEHGESCTETRLVCGLTEESHYHDDGCYSASLRCHIPENHSHGQSCYETTVICGKGAGQVHTHTQSCYGGQPQLHCQMAENHVHDSGCYNQVLICNLPEDPGHRHEDACYQWNKQLECRLEEGAPEPTEAPEPVLICTEPDAPAHVHQDSCFEQTEQTSLLLCQGGEDHQHTDACYTCGLEAHEHTLICYSDPEADVETPDVWKATFSHVTLTGDLPADVVAIAESQIGYTESSRNYEVWEDNSIHGYTRYGDWFGSPHGDWCAMFVSFCLHYAEVEDMPLHWGVRPWIEELSSRGLYYSARNTKPQKGNLIFFDWEGDGLSDHVGIVAEVQEALEHTGASVKAIEGNSSNMVRYQYYSPDDPVILGYGLLPGQEQIPVTAVEPDDVPSNLQAILICGMPAHTHGEICYRTDGTCICTLEEHVHKIDCIDPSIPIGFADGGSVMRMLSAPRTESTMNYHTNLTPLFKSVEIYDSNNNLVYGSSGSSGSGTVTIGENCLIKVTFAEDEFNQFSTEGDGILHYDIPSNLSAVLVGSGVIRNRNNDIIATYQIVNNQMIFTPVLVNGQNFFGAFNNVSLGINFNAEVIHSEGSTQTDINFNGNFKVTIKVNEDAKIDAQKQAGEYDPDTGTITYQCKVSSYGGTIPLTYVSDWWWPKNTASLVPNSITLKDKDGTELNLDDWTLESNADDFKLTPKTPVTLAHGEFITLSYQVKIHDDIVENYDLNNSFFAISNQDGNQLQDTDTATTPVTVTNVEKTGVHEKEMVEGSSRDVLKWTVIIDNANLDTIQITDELGNGQDFCEHHPISVKATKLDGTEEKITIPWANVQVVDDNRFTTTLPSVLSADGKNVYKKYEIVYYSHFALEAGNSGLQVFENTVTTDVTIGGKPTMGTGSIGVVGIPPEIDKTAQSDAEWITFTITSRMPGGLYNQPNVLVYDSLSAWVNETGYYFQQNPDSMRITITPDGGTAYELQPYTGQDSTDNTYLLVKDGQDFTIYFNTDQPGAATSVWKCPEDSTMTISYRVSRNAPLLDGWGGNPTDETLQDYLDEVHPGITNSAKLDYAPGYSVEDYVYHTPAPKPKPSLTKTAELATVDGVVQDGVYNYSVLVDTTSGIFNTKADDWRYDISSLIFTDTFDSRMEYVPGSFKVKAWSVWNVYEECVFLENKAPQIKESGNTVTMVVDAANLKATKTYMAGQSLVNLMQEFVSGKFEFVYQLKVKDTIKQNTTEGVLLLDNTASIEWEDRFGTQTVTPAHNQVEYDTGVLQKGMAVVDDSNVVEFSILVNHNGLDLAADGDTYVLYDTMSSNLILLYDTLKVEIIKKAPEQNSVLSLTECKFEYDLDRNRMTFVLPDNEVIRLTYRCRVDGLGGTTTDVSNHVELLGRSTIQDVVESKFEIKAHEGSADADSEAFYLRKQDGNNRNVLAGVTFKLYGDVKPDGYEGAPDFIIDHTAHAHEMYLLGSFTTGEDGIAHITHTQLTKKHLYALEEVSPPNGYVALSERYLFYVEERENGALQEIPCIINNQLVVIDNYPIGYELPATGGTGRELYTVGGMLLIWAAVILLYRQKKCRVEDFQSS